MVHAHDYFLLFSFTALSRDIFGGCRGTLDDVPLYGPTRGVFHVISSFLCCIASSISSMSCLHEGAVTIEG